LDKRLSSAGKALRALKNPRNINKNPISVQPLSSEIKLIKTSDFIEIVIPPRGINFGLIALLSAAVAVNTALRFNVYNNFWGINNSQMINRVFFMISGSLLAAVGVMFLFALFRELRLRMDGQQISYSSHLLGLKWNYARPAPRQDICQLEIAQIEYTMLDKQKKLYRDSQVIVQAGNQKYRIAVKQGLNKLEIEWLGMELSQWLGLKIKITSTYSKATR